MSFKGEIEVRCPKGCEPFTTEIWSFIRGDQSPALREAVLARECNLLLCPACDTAFIPEEPYVYFEPQAELLAFVFPESYRDRRDYWLGKMRDDFLLMREALGGEITLDVEPQIFFGFEELAELLEREDYRAEEREVMECLAGELGLSLYRVSPSFSRRSGIPRSLPYATRDGAPATLRSVMEGLEKLVGANDRLTSYGAYLKSLKSSDPGEFLPPPAGLPPGQRKPELRPAPPSAAKHS